MAKQQARKEFLVLYLFNSKAGISEGFFFNLLGWNFLLQVNRFVFRRLFFLLLFCVLKKFSFYTFPLGQLLWFHLIKKERETCFFLYCIQLSKLAVYVYVCKYIPLHPFASPFLSLISQPHICLLFPLLFLFI